MNRLWPLPARLPFEIVRRCVLALLVGGAGGLLAYSAHLPLAFMLGSLFATMTASIAGAPLWVPNRVRAVFLTLVGLFLGQSFSPGAMNVSPAWLGSIALAILYVPVAAFLCSRFYHHAARLDRLTALFAAIPGGLSAVVLFSGALGGDERKVALSQSLRIAIVVVAAPTVFFGLLGFAQPAAEANEVVMLVTWREAVLLLGGSVLAILAMQAIGAPMPSMIAPIFASALLRLFGLVEGELPVWLVEAALVVTGSSIGSRFAGAYVRELVKLALWTFLGTALLIVISAVFAAFVSAVFGVDYMAALLAFAPGGVAEMCLIAIALHSDPGFVATHHLARIGFILLAAPFFAAWLERRNATAAE